MAKKKNDPVDLSTFDGIETALDAALSPEEITDVLREVVRLAAAKAAQLQETIDDSYRSRDAAEKELKSAGAARDLERYEDATVRYHMENEYISTAETEQARLVSGHLIGEGTYKKILSRLNGESMSILKSAAVEIADKLREIRTIHADALREIGRRNAAILYMHSEAWRGKRESGNPSSAPVYRDAVITPYLRDIDRMNTPTKTAFDIFSGK